MKNARHCIRALAMAVMLVGAPVSAARSESYGPNDQVVTIGVTDFHPQQSQFLKGFYVGSDGYLYGDGMGDGNDYTAPLPLPDGALVQRICLYAYDATSTDATVSLVAVKQTPGGEQPYKTTVASVSSFGNTGYGYQCTNVSYVLRRFRDLDGDGTPDAVSYSLRENTAGKTGFGGVRVTWKRQVSAPPDPPSFDDVPASDDAYPYIEALAASGITVGCGGRSYCPDAPLTRRQMAVYLAKALGLHWVE